MNFRGEQKHNTFPGLRGAPEEDLFSAIVHLAEARLRLTRAIRGMKLSESHDLTPLLETLQRAIEQLERKRDA